MQDLESQVAREETRRKKLQEEKELFESKERTTDSDIARLEDLHVKMVEERGMLEEQVRLPLPIVGTAEICAERQFDGESVRARGQVQADAAREGEARLAAGGR